MIVANKLLHCHMSCWKLINAKIYEFTVVKFNYPYGFCFNFDTISMYAVRAIMILHMYLSIQS